MFVIEMPYEKEKSVDNISTSINTYDELLYAATYILNKQW